MLPDTVAAVAADAAVAVAAAAAAAAAQTRRSFPTGESSFVDGTSYLLSGSLECDEPSAAPQSPPGSSRAIDNNANDEDEWRGVAPDQWRYLRLLTGHWSPWTVSLIALRRLPLPPAGWRELRACSSSLKLLVLENCELSSAEFCCDLAFDGSEAAPVCKVGGYEEAVLTLLPHEPATKAWGLPQSEPFQDALIDLAGPRGCGTRLEILDGRRLHLPPLKLAVSEAITAAAETRAATRRFREGMRLALKDFQLEQMPASEAPTLKGNQMAAGCTREEGPQELRKVSASVNQSKAARLPPLSSTSHWLVPAEACRAVRELLAREVQESLTSAQKVVQQVTRASLAAKRGVLAPT
ncbi:hypothetical protein Emag_001779 [Eimeria magna]